MEKFLSIPVTDEQTQLVSANGIILIEQASATTTTIQYGGGKVVTITHSTTGASTTESMRDAIQAAVVNALQTPWTNVAYLVSGLPCAVSGIAVA